jgi:hypothetical protein
MMLETRNCASVQMKMMYEVKILHGVGANLRVRPPIYTPHKHQRAHTQVRPYHDDAIIIRN